MATPKGSTWWCELCGIEVWIRGTPKRQRCASCRKWMVRRWPPKKG
jgi:hypothetical protein